jgi:hypothetical protein
LNSSEMLVASLDFRRRESAYLLDLNKLNFVVVENSPVSLTSGYGIEIYLVNKGKEELVAFFAMNSRCYFFCIDRIYDLTDPRLSAEVNSSFREKCFTLRSDREMLVQFKYKYRDDQTDLLREIADMLKDPLKGMFFKQMAEFFCTQDPVDRNRVGQENARKLHEARINVRKEMNVFAKIKDIYRYGL